MLQLCRRVRSTEYVSRILTGYPQCLIMGGRNLIHTTNTKQFIDKNNLGSLNPRSSRHLEPPVGGRLGEGFNSGRKLDPPVGGRIVGEGFNNPVGGRIVGEGFKNSGSLNPRFPPVGGRIVGEGFNNPVGGRIVGEGLVLEEERRSPLYGVGLGGGRNPEDEKLDVVHVKMIRNNTFVTITDSKGNKKAGASSGCLEEMKGGPKVSRYAAEATAEHVGRLARNLGLKSVVMRVNGFTHFKKKKQAILAWKEGFTRGRMDRNPIMYIEDTTRKAHNGCRLPKQRRV